MEIALRPRDAFKNANRATLSLRVPTGQVVCAGPSTHASPRPPKSPSEPRIKKLMRMALQWQRLLDSGHIASRVDIARRENLSQARVSQIMYLIDLAPKIQNHILNLPKSVHRSAITDRALRPITQVGNARQQR